ncbi:MULTISPECIES: hypothetical protein [unclassified Variovorax]|uniref:hypothetical protein n=1 Tax=unclassified Variovorax TaxID=663243 RepID=UPI003F47D134
MPLDYLRKIEHVGLPLLVDDENDIRCIAVLLAAGLLDAAVPPPSAGGEADGVQLPAVVKKITPLGRAELSRRGGPQGPGHDALKPSGPPAASP